MLMRSSAWMENSSVFTMLLVCSWALSERLHRSSPRHLAAGIPLSYVQSLTHSPKLMEPGGISNCACAHCSSYIYIPIGSSLWRGTWYSCGCEFVLQSLRTYLAVYTHIVSNKNIQHTVLFLYNPISILHYRKKVHPKTILLIENSACGLLTLLVNYCVFISHSDSTFIAEDQVSMWCNAFSKSVIKK